VINTSHTMAFTFQNYLMYLMVDYKHNEL